MKIPRWFCGFYMASTFLKFYFFPIFFHLFVRLSDFYKLAKADISWICFLQGCSEAFEARAKQKIWIFPTLWVLFNFSSNIGQFSQMLTAAFLIVVKILVTFCIFHIAVIGQLECCLSFEIILESHSWIKCLELWSCSFWYIAEFNL